MLRKSHIDKIIKFVKLQPGPVVQSTDSLTKSLAESLLGPTVLTKSFVGVFLLMSLVLNKLVQFFIRVLGLSNSFRF